MSAFGGRADIDQILQNSESVAADNGVTTVSDNGLITIASAYSVKDTIDRVEKDIKLKGLTVFARVDEVSNGFAHFAPDIDARTKEDVFILQRPSNNTVNIRV